MTHIDKLYTRLIRYIDQQEVLYGKPEFQPTNSSEHARPELPNINSDTTPTDGPLVELSNDPEMIINPDITDPKLASIQTLDELKLYCESLDTLKTDLSGTKLVFGKGNPKADLMLIGEAPGAEEDKLGEPFVGRSGQLLTKILAAINISREDIYIANILKHRPPDNRNPSPEERKRSLPYLLKQIQIVNPKLILCLGKVPTETLLQTKSSLKELRGTFHPFMENYEVLLTYHPAYLLRDPRKKHDTWEDVQLLRKRYDELGCKP
ncbi:MAG: uracil-DNA glycosylase [Bacteroidetes bacterium]|nr:uracil-DNA glycosylase [Bacteroidota bacterium]MCH8523515.1 uracil-DNA glycosylase [Balneolales bacterium]